MNNLQQMLMGSISPLVTGLMTDPLTGVTPGGIDSEYSGLLAQYYERAILEGVFQEYGLWNKMSVESFPQRNGYQGTFFRYPDIPSLIGTTGSASDAETLAVADTAEGEHMAATTVKTAQWNVTLKGLGGWINPSEVAKLTTIDGLKKLPDKVKQWANKTMEDYLQVKLAPFGRLVRPDASASFELEILVTTSTSTTVFNATAANGLGDNFCANSTMTCIDPESPNYGLSRKITSFADANDTFTVAVAWPYQPAVGEKFWVSDPQDLYDNTADTDQFDYVQLRYCAKQLRKNGAYGASIEIPGGGYHLVYDAEFENQLGDSSQIQTMWQYKDTEDGIRTYKPGMISMMRPSLTFSMYRIDHTDVHSLNKAGLVGIASIFGKESLTRMPIEKGDLQIIHKPKKSGGTSNPLELYETLGWKLYQAVFNKDANRTANPMAYHA